MLGRRVLYTRTMSGIAQETYALPTVYQLSRIAIADATAPLPAMDSDWASFSIDILLTGPTSP